MPNPYVPDDPDEQVPEVVEIHVYEVTIAKYRVDPRTGAVSVTRESVPGYEVGLETTDGDGNEIGDDPLEEWACDRVDAHRAGR